MSLINQDYGLSTDFAMRRGDPKKFMLGAELEIEDVQRWSPKITDMFGIQVVEDGSLRNNGHEFLLPPHNRAQQVDVFKAFHTGLKVGENPFSSRTSTHVHVNMLFATPNQCRNLLLLYAIFEPLAFSYVGRERKNNIHCVPLNMTYMPALYKNSFNSIMERWHKYTALNLLPICKLGTIEFRHLEGTDDPVRFDTWLGFLETLWQAAMDLKETSLREHLLDLKYLKDLEAKLLTVDFRRQCVEPVDFVLEQNLMDVKLAFIS